MGTTTFDLTGKTAIVTGATRGIGRAIAELFAQHGAKVVISSRKQDACDEVAAAINEAGGEAIGIAAHAGDLDQIAALFEQTKEAFGGVDVLVNNAATNPYFGPMVQIEARAWDKTFEVNTRGYFETSRAFALQCVADGRPGAIVNVASIMGLRAAPMQGVYGMTKAAITSMTQTMAAELGADQIRVNAIAPGLIDTKFASALTANDALVDQFLARTPVGRIGVPEDIAPLALFLASDAAGFINGQTVIADGGYTLF
jgi:NAD(P)-dependent dehydrogenase (short-subunit alcohol dehydrogenase family)